jgi:hypothetical protein
MEPFLWLQQVKMGRRAMPPPPGPPPRLCGASRYHQFIRRHRKQLPSIEKVTINDPKLNEGHPFFFDYIDRLNSQQGTDRKRSRSTARRPPCRNTQHPMVRAAAMPAKGSTDSSVLASPPQRQMRNSAQRYMRRRSSQLQKESETAARDVGIRLLQEGRLVVRTAVERNSAALHWAPDTFKNDRERILELVRRDGLVLQHVEPEWQNDHGVVMAAVLQNGWAFRFASSALRADHEVVEAAVEAHGRNLCYVSDQRLRSDRELLLRCIAKNAWALQWVSDTLRLERDFLVQAVEANGWALAFAHASHLSAPYRDSRALVNAAAKQGAAPSLRGRSRICKDPGAACFAVPYGRGGHDALLQPLSAVDAKAHRLRATRLPWREPRSPWQRLSHASKCRTTEHAPAMAQPRGASARAEQEGNEGCSEPATLPTVRFAHSPELEA